MKREVNYNRIGIPGILGVVFIVLKLTGIISWSWWWVLAPFWIPAGIAVLVLLAMGVTVLVIRGRSKW